MGPRAARRPRSGSSWSTTRSWSGPGSASSSRPPTASPWWVRPPNAESAISAVTAHRPDVVLMDIRMPGMDGLEAARHITGFSPAPKVVILTTFDLDDYVYEALRSGASGFLLKDSPRHDLIAAVRAAAAGDALLAPSVTRLLIETFARRPAAAVTAPSRLASLTAREKDILLLVARG